MTIWAVVTYLTNIFGRPSHYYETLPFGEMMVEHNQSLYTAGQYNNAFKFNGKELDEATQMYYYGARYYEPRFSIFVSVDPLAEETMEPYSYVGNNPIMFTDPTGMSKDDIIIGKSIRDNFTTSQAFDTFASTKEGISYLSDYAKKGDVIAGHTYTEDGKYHKQGIDLIFEAKDLGSSTRGYTETSMNGDRANIAFTINSNSKVSSQDGNTYDMGVLSQPYSKANTDIAVKGILSRTMTVFHETFIHGYSATQDFLDDKSFNKSNIDGSIKKSYSTYKNHWDHIQIQIGSDRSSQLFNTKGLNGIKSANSKWSSGKHYNNSQLGNMMWRFSGSWKK